MASLAKHNEDCVRWLGYPHEEVHRWLDEFFAVCGPSHRKVRHHREGIEVARKLFGDKGAAAAIIHILRDCRNIPRADDYETGAADQLGLKSRWPASAYIHYTEEAFDTLVKYNLEGPMAIVLWVFFRSAADLDFVLQGISRLSDEQRQERLQRWAEAAQRFEQIQKKPIEPTAVGPLPDSLLEYCEGLRGQNYFTGLEAQFGKLNLGMAPIDQLINPLALIDYEYIEELKASLTGTELRDLVRFSIPERLEAPVKVVQDVSRRIVTVISSEKAFSLTPMIVTPIPGVGVEVRMLIAGTPQLVMISKVGGRLYLRNGMHRVYLLASLGVKYVPCVILEEAQIPFMSGAYPTFSPLILALPRPPLLIDAFDPTMVLTVPTLRTNKIIRIAGEELVLPVD